MEGYLIRVRREFYAPHPNEVSYAGKCGLGWDRPLVPFKTREEARAWVDEFDQEIYHGAHGESGRPVMHVVKLIAASRAVRELAAEDIKVWENGCP